jgi:hypothetical protein
MSREPHRAPRVSKAPRRRTQDLSSSPECPESPIELPEFPERPDAEPRTSAPAQKEGSKKQKKQKTWKNSEIMKIMRHGFFWGSDNSLPLYITRFLHPMNQKPCKTQGKLLSEPKKHCAHDFLEFFDFNGFVILSFFLDSSSWAGDGVLRKLLSEPKKTLHT